VFRGPHPETGEPLEVADHAPEGALPQDMPPQETVFAPDYAPEEIAEIAQRLRKDAGLPDKVTAKVAEPQSMMGKVTEKLRR
jgi:Mn-containing catalase